MSQVKFADPGDANHLNMDDAHVDASALSLSLVAIIAIIDLFVAVADCHPSKILGYFLMFIVFYGVSYLVFRLLWNR